MLQNPDIAPSASINRWIAAILTYHFTLVHVPGIRHGPDGLSRRPHQPNDPLPVTDDEDDEDTTVPFLTIHLTEPHIATRLSRHAATLLLQPEPVPQQELQYSEIPRTKSALDADSKLQIIPAFLDSLVRPPSYTDKAFRAFVKFASQFFTSNGKLWKRDDSGAHKLVLPPERRVQVLVECHDRSAHRGVFATIALIMERFWWPFLKRDTAWFVRTCHICQTRQHRHILIPPTVAQPAPLFAKAYMDTMHLPASNGFHYIVQARCSLIHWPEYRNLRRETGKAIGDWIHDDLLCRWGALSEIVTDNGKPFVNALDYLAKRYHITHIRISGYNSRANGLVERAHYDVRQALFKAADGDASKWSQVAASVFWSERITTRKRMGCSPYFAATGTHPLIPLDIVEATYLLPAPQDVMTTTDLIAQRAIALQKRREDLTRIKSAVYLARRRAALRFEEEHRTAIRDFDFQRGDLVLMRNTAIEKALNRKMRARYLGPLVVVARNKGGAYILCELDGSVLDRPVAAFRLVPYLARRTLTLPNDFENITPERLRAMTDEDSLGDDMPEESEDDHEEREENEGDLLDA